MGNKGKKEKKSQFSIKRIYSALFLDSVKEEFWEKRRSSSQKLLAENPEKLEKVKDFVCKYCPPNKYKELFGEEKPDIPEAIDLNQEIQEAYARVNAKYKYFPQEASGEDFEKFAKYYRAFKFRQVSEKQLTDDLLAEGAYRGAVFFDGDLDVLDQTINRSEKMASTPAPIHDIAIIDIPEAQEYGSPGFNLKDWQKLIKSTNDGTSVEILEKFQHAHFLEAKLKGQKFPQNLKQIQSELAELSYASSDKDPQMAKVFGRYKISEERFEKALEFKSKQLGSKEEDNIPDVTAAAVVKVQEAGQDKQKDTVFYALKLPSTDPRALILGNITGCCQNFDGNSHLCVQDGINLPNNGFYLFVKAKPGLNPKQIDWDNLEDSATIVGQSYVWRGTRGNICLDSLEVSDKIPSYDFPAKELLDTLSQKFMESDPSIERVTVGDGGRTNKFRSSFTGKEATIPETMKQGVIYGDADDQYEITLSNKLIEARSKTEEIYGEVVDITSSSQLEVLQSTPKEVLEKFRSKEGSLEAALVYSDLSGKSLEEIGAYSEGKVNTLLQGNIAQFVRLEGFDIEEAEALYDKALIDRQSATRFNAIFSDMTLECLKEEWISFEELKGMETGKIQALTSPESVECLYEYISFEEMKSMETSKIRALTSKNAMACYKTDMPPSFEELKDLDDRSITLLTSNNARYCYQDKTCPDFVELKDLSDKDFKRLTTEQAIKCYQSSKGPSFEQLKDLSEVDFKRYTSKDARRCYASIGGPNFVQLQELDNDDFEVYTCDEAFSCYELEKAPNFVQLQELVEKGTIHDFISLPAMICYEREEGPSYEQMQDFDSNKIRAFARQTVQQYLQKCEDFDLFSKMYDKQEGLDIDERIDLAISDTQSAIHEQKYKAKAKKIASNAFEEAEALPQKNTTDKKPKAPTRDLNT